MDFEQVAKGVLSLYPISDPAIEFIRHNENITLKITDQLSDKKYLLRIHKPSTDGLFGVQHTREGLQSEVALLQELHRNQVLTVQVPVANLSGDYVTECAADGLPPCFATLLEWIDGPTLTLQEDNVREIVFAIGESLARFHEFTRANPPANRDARPKYDAERIDFAIEELQYGVESGLFRPEHYEVMKEVLAAVKNQIEELDAQGGARGLIHADVQLGNVVIHQGAPCLIDYCLSGFGYYLFDVGSASCILESGLRATLLEGYASTTKTAFTRDMIRQIEGFIFMDILISYAFFVRDAGRNRWIKDHAPKLCDTLCKEFLEGKEVYYSF